MCNKYIGRHQTKVVFLHEKILNLKKNPSRSPEKTVNSIGGIELMFNLPDYVWKMKLMSKNFSKVLQHKSID